MMDQFVYIKIFFIMLSYAKEELPPKLVFQQDNNPDTQVSNILVPDKKDWDNGMASLIPWHQLQQKPLKSSF